MSKRQDVEADRSCGSEGEEFSFEFFPPHSAAMSLQLRNAAERLRRFHPRFVSVTYGAGGGTRDATMTTLLELGRISGLSVAGHLTCVGESRARVNEVAQSFWRSGVRHVVALRGDPPIGSGSYRPHPGGYRDAADLVAGLKRIADFEVSVAGYPEVHPDAPSAAHDLANLERKLDAGASRIITQFCFDSDRILQFVETVRARGISMPIAVGILPIRDFRNTLQLSSRCGASVPEWIHRAFNDKGAGSPSTTHVGESIALEQCVHLRNNGIRRFHFYTLNRAELTEAVCRHLNRDTGEIVERPGNEATSGPRVA